MDRIFQTACGTIKGTRHVRAGRNNQDAFSVEVGENALVAIVADGCSEGRHSEVGANLAAKYFAAKLARVSNADPVGFLAETRLEALKFIRVNALELGADLNKTLRDYFLFTVVGILITSEIAITFSIGDGVINLNGENHILGPFPDNQPPYLVYGLTRHLTRVSFLTEAKGGGPQVCRFRQEGEVLKDPLGQNFTIHHVVPTETVRTVLIGTDGTLDLIEAGEKNLPGKNEKLGSLSQFWSNDINFSNQDSIRRRLFLANQVNSKPEWVSRKIHRCEGLLPDDTTIVVIRRKLEE